ncbi:MULTISPECIES: hypothetical protein [unclassified Streptomyces]|uniref:hypothetical protein n=1 Tax=unclassified Streptomyces TaxID=2593676 RepID=UPI000D1AADF1|nr:hypothetical protein [Streptomyces sp. SAT1]
MNADQTEALIGMLFTFGLLVLMALPSVLGILRDRRIDRSIREAQQAHRDQESATREPEAQKSSSRSTVPSTATWYADGRRSKKLVSS